MSPRPGTDLSVWLLLLLSSPAMASVCPLPITTVVEADCVDSDGTTMDVPATAIWKAFCVVGELTVGWTCRMMLPLSSTTGRNFSCTPNFLYCTVTWPFCPGTGTGKDPPSMKLALCPDSAVSVGSARICARLSLFSASSTLSIAPPPTESPAL